MPSQGTLDTQGLCERVVAGRSCSRSSDRGTSSSRSRARRGCRLPDRRDRRGSRADRRARPRPTRRAGSLLEAGLASSRLSFSTERIDSGNAEFGLRNTPKIVACLTPGATEVAVTIYGQLVDKVIPVSSPRVAETAKLFENTFRHVTIAVEDTQRRVPDITKVHELTG